jgi:hypothetical protein
VAPHSSGVEDPRYIDFLNQVGDEPCRTRLKDFQREVLLRRDEMLARMADQASAMGYAYDAVGIGPIFESTVSSFSFAFWQYYGADRCSDIPLMGASDNEVWSFFDEIGSPLYSSDPWFYGFEPYSWQAYTELGAPAIDTSHLDDLLIFDWDMIDDLPSVPQEPVYNPAAMQDISAWLASQGERILFIYGQTDPWTAGAFDPAGAKESAKYVMPNGNHSANIAGLVPADQQAALAALEAWTGVVPEIPQAALAPKPRAPSFRLLRRSKAH